MLNKIQSGRWILTVSSACVFGYCAVAGILDAPTISAILMFVFKSYFDRGDRADNDKTNN